MFLKKGGDIVKGGGDGGGGGEKRKWRDWYTSTYYVQNIDLRVGKIISSWISEEFHKIMIVLEIDCDKD